MYTHIHTHIHTSTPDDVDSIGNRAHYKRIVIHRFFAWSFVRLFAVCCGVILVTSFVFYFATKQKYVYTISKSTTCNSFLFRLRNPCVYDKQECLLIKLLKLYRLKIVKKMASHQFFFSHHVGFISIAWSNYYCSYTRNHHGKYISAK